LVKRFSRRTVVVAGAAALGAAALLRPRDEGEGGHDGYFTALSGALKRAGVAQPSLIVDRRRLSANIAVVRHALAPTGLGLRVVTKSLQATGLLQAVLSGAQTAQLMVFNGVTLEEIVKVQPTADVLLGRPLPAAQVEEFVRKHKDNPFPAAHPQWLVDSPERLAQYAAIGKNLGARMRLNLELDVGLHRGGLPDAAAVAHMIDLAAADRRLQITGLMGYDAHVPSVLDPAREMAGVRHRYAEARAVLLGKIGGDPGALTLNTAGSPTYRMHLDDKVANEVSIGSAFVKPMNYDLDTLSRHIPAAFIAEPVLKKMDQALIPTIEPMAGLINVIDPNSREGFFAYGGYGDAEPVSPPGLRFSPLYGGRAMLTGSENIGLKQDDFIFFRPKESEGVFLQFGDILVFDGHDIVERWPTFPVAA
jgi:D-serine deaminase-like pyridoxal phosphate-dependent protein